MKKIFFPALILSFAISGCQWNQGPEELERLIKEDSAFKAMIAQRDQARSQMALIKEDLIKKKQIVDAQTEKLRASYDLYAKAQNRKIEQFRATIDANRTKLKSDISAAETSIETKETELDGYQKTLGDVQKVLKDPKGITLSAQEKKRWSEHVLMLTEKIRPLTEEIQELKLQVRLKKQKIAYLD